MNGDARTRAAGERAPAEAFATAVEAATPADLPAIEALLMTARLPTSDLATAPDLRFWIVRRNGRVAGAIGLERYGEVALVRSLVVAPECREQRLGSALVERLEREARAAGISALVLLTQTAERFFARRGYTRIERADAPEPVRASAEFASLCPASAATMILQIAEHR